MLFPQGFVRVLESFGKLWKLKMPFSKRRKGLEKKEGFQNGYGKVLDVYLKKFLSWMSLSVLLNTSYVMFVDFTIYNI